MIIIEGSSGGGLYVGPIEPPFTSVLWIDTSIGGVAKYYNGTKWVPIKSVWGE